MEAFVSLPMIDRNIPKKRTEDGRTRTEVKSLKKSVGNASPWVNRFIAFLFLHNLRPPSSVLRPSQGFH